MDKGQVRQGFIFAFVICIFAALVIAAVYIPIPAALLSSPTTGDWQNNNTFIQLNGTCVGNESSYDYRWWITNSTGHVYHLNHTESTVTNNTLMNATILNWEDSPSVGYDWFLECLNIDGFNSSVWNVKVDVTNPVVITPNPLNNTWDTDGEVTLSGRCQESNPKLMYFSINAVENMSLTATYQNDIEENITVHLDDAQYLWDVNCTDDAGNFASNGTMRTLTVDTIKPIITMNTLDGIWWNIATDNNLTINFTLTETNPDTCELWANYSTTGVTPTYVLNRTLRGSTEIALNFMFDRDLADSNYTDGFDYFIQCNDSANQIVNSGNKTLYIDTIAPTMPAIARVKGGAYNGHIKTTDHTPNIEIVNVTDTNSLTYSFEVYNTDYSLYGIENTTTTTYGDYGIALDFNKALLADTNYTYNITVYDLAGNANYSGGDGAPGNNSYSWYTDGHNRYIYDNTYFYMGLIIDDCGGYKNASTIAEETGATYIYKYNSTHGWDTHQSGETTNAYMNFSYLAPVIGYGGSDTVWDDKIWPSSACYNITEMDLSVAPKVLGDVYNFTNATVIGGDGYNLFTWMNFTTGNFTFMNVTIEEGKADYIDIPNNNTINYISLINNSASGDTENDELYVPWRWEWTINDNVQFRYGDAFWVFYNSTTGYEWNMTLGDINKCTWGYC